jgi:hypothetical protein
MTAYGYPRGSLDAIGPVHGPRHPVVTCARCGCCSLREPTDPDSCCGPCEPCGHHKDCIECERTEREIQELRRFVQGIVWEARQNHWG